MLTVDILKQNTSLAGLTDEQFKAIALMSQNDENVVLGAKIGALHGQYDTDILTATGVEKASGEKSYDYLKRVLTAYKDTIHTREAKITELTNKIAAGTTDEDTKKMLKDLKSQVGQLQKELTTKENAFKEAEAKHKQDLVLAKVDFAFKEAASGLKFKEGITSAVQDILFKAAKAEVLSKGTPEVTDNGVILRDFTGQVLNNPSNGLNPYTLNELLLQTSLKDVLDLGRQQTGAGTQSPTQNQSNTFSGVLNLSVAKTQLEADELISKHLFAEGLTRDDPAFQERLMKIRTEAKVQNLPIR